MNSRFLPESSKAEEAHVAQMPWMVLIVAALMSFGHDVVAAANYFWKTSGGEAMGNWTSLENWWSNKACTTQSASLPGSAATDTVLFYTSGKGAEVSSDVTASPLQRLATLAIGASGDASAPSFLVVRNGGAVLTKALDLGGLDGSNPRYGNLTIEAGGTMTLSYAAAASESLNIGQGGVGTITNAGAVTVNTDVNLGGAAGGHGTWVSDGGSITFGNGSYNLNVGKAGIGEVEVVSGTFSGSCYVIGYPNKGCVNVGGSETVTSRITVQDGATLKNGIFYVGGYPECPTGKGEIVLRGGRIENAADFGGRDAIFLGACPQEGGVSPSGYGAIRGWGEFYGSTYALRRTGGFRLRLGCGEIVADGEGVERTLDCCTALVAATNCLSAGVLTTSGWRAENKGKVELPYAEVCASLEYGGTKCVGCASDAEKPDLVNSVRVAVSRTFQSSNPIYLYGALCAADRNDAHTNSLPNGCNVLGVWKLGTFKSVGERTMENTTSFSAAEISFRYDQTKIQGSDTALEVWRYLESTGKWTRLNRVRPDNRPSDCVLDAGKTISNCGELCNMGTFAVVERPVSGMVLIVR